MGQERISIIFFFSKGISVLKIIQIYVSVGKNFINILKTDYYSEFWCQNQNVPGVTGISASPNEDIAIKGSILDLNHWYYMYVQYQHQYYISTDISFNNTIS